MVILTFHCFFSSHIFKCKESGTFWLYFCMINFETASLYSIVFFLNTKYSLFSLLSVGLIAIEHDAWESNYIWSNNLPPGAPLRLPCFLSLWLLSSWSYVWKTAFLEVWQVASEAVNSWSMPTGEDILEDSSRMWTSCPFSHYNPPFILYLPWGQLLLDLFPLTTLSSRYLGIREQ